MEHRRVAHPAPPPGRGRLPRRPGHLALDRVQALGHRAGGDDAALRIHVARSGGVAAPDLDAIEAEPLGQVVHLGLDGERALEVAVAAHRARVRVVGVDDAGVEAHRGDAVEPGGGGEHHVGCRRAPRDVGAVVDHHARVAAEQPAVAVRRGPQVDHARLAGRARDELLDALEGDLHGPAGAPGQERGDDVDRVEIEPAAEVAAHRRLDHAHPVAGDAEGLGQVALVEKRHLGGAPHGERGVGALGRVPGRDRGHRAQAGGGHVVEPVFALHHDGRPREGRVHVAVRELVAEVDQVAPAPLVHERGVRPEGRRRVEHRGQLLVVHPDAPHRLLGDLLGQRGHRGDLVADAAHLAAVGRAALERQVILGEAERVLLHAVGGDHRDHPGQRLGRARVDPEHARVRVAGPEDRAVGEARQGEIVEELGVPGDLLDPVALRGVLADDAEAHRGRAPEAIRGPATGPRPSASPGPPATAPAT